MTLSGVYLVYRGPPVSRLIMLLENHHSLNSGEGQDVHTAAQARAGMKLEE